ncbi:MAG TPA: YXWGXW repeat-containing protein, partial [Mucilaginibacter sp.]|nr:YXWGXW repeat-containing protein [Mucilaginibacter sp.]
MKKLTLVILPLLAFQLSRAQVTDTHPAAEIYAINYQNGQEERVNSEQAILFKDAFINLVNHTDQARLILHMNRGKKIAVIKQVDPQRFNGYQLTWENQQQRVLCTFYYNIDQNALFFYDTGVRDWVNVTIEDENAANLDACRQYAGFNSQQQGTPDLSVNNGQQLSPDLSVAANPQQDDATTEMQAGLDTLSDEEITAAAAPPELPEYDQPPCPVEGYLWQPGYWAWSRTAVDYYWVPGVWVAPPRPGLLWTPCYWGFVGGIYRYHPGYWGVTVGFYGGIHYGFGYMGVGFVGGEWRGGVYRYNTAVVHVNTTVVHNTYINRTVINNTTVVNRSSFNGQGGVTARPNSQEQAAMHQQHFRATNDQLAHQQESRDNRNQFASANHGRPAVTSMAKVNPAPASFRSNTGNR